MLTQNSLVSKSFFSIYIPSYKNVEFLKRLLESICIQTFKDFELIIVDDSPDISVEKLIEEKKEKLIGINVYYKHNSPALGMPQNWNYGLSLCKGDWIKIMHDDDWFRDENSLSILASHAKETKNQFLVSAYTNVYSNDKQENVFLNDSHKRRIEKDPIVLISKNVIGPPSVVCVHSSISEYYDNRLKWRVDIDYYIRVLHKCQTFTYINEPLVMVGIGEVQVTQEVKNVKTIELPESGILWEKYGMSGLKSIYVYDGWWRFIRNLHVQSTDVNLLPQNEWPKPIIHILKWQSKFSSSLLRVGIFSKILMAFSFLTLDKSEC